MACATLYQCFNFLARHNGVISLANNPDNPCKNRCVIRVGDDVAVAVEYGCTEEMDLFTRVILPVCKALQEEVEG